MAESKGSRRYGKGPKIVPKEEMGTKVESTTPDKGGSAGPKTAEASGTDKIPVSKEKTEQPAAPVEEGTHMPMHEVHTRELKTTNDRHEKERRDMNSRHEQELRSLHNRHAKEREPKAA